MKKLKLMLDELAVETFETVNPVDRRGTVVGRGDSSAGPRECAYMCTAGCPSDQCFTDACIFTDFGCDTGPGATEDYSCVCQSNEWECAGTDYCPSVEPTSCAQVGC